MKLYSKRFLAMLLALLLVFGMVPMMSAEPLTFDGTTKLYVDLSACEDDWWKNDMVEGNCLSRAYFFGSGDPAWATMTRVGEEGYVFSCTIPQGSWECVILCRCDPGSNPGWDGVYNQTGDIPLEEGKNYITHFGGVGSTDATWAVYEEPVDPPVTEGRTYDGTEKIYINGLGVSWWDDYSPLHRLVFKNAAGEETTLDLAWVENISDTERVFGAAVPAGTYTAVKITRCSSDASEVYNSTDWITVPEDGNYIKVFAQNSTEATWDTYTPGETPVDPPDPPVTEGRTYDGTEKIYINGLGVSWWDDYSPLHRLVFKNSAGEETTLDLAWVENISETERAFGAAVPAGTYVSVKITRCSSDGSQVYNSTDWITVPADGNYIKVFAQNSAEATWDTYVPGQGGNEPGDHGEADDKVILHCWNWSYDEIHEYLPQIKAAGYTAVQTSPAQPHSGYKEGQIGTGDWWMLYQPLGLHIAQANQSWLGGVDELSNLCDAAHELGIEVIVDVVSNHICNAYNDIAVYDEEGNLTYDPKCDAERIAGTNGYRFEVLPDSHVADFNPELFTEGLTRYFRDYVNCNDEQTENVVHGNIGMPDFKTEEPAVQQAVLTYLKELIDAGVDGFRFDAAKHIETPDDGDYASQFWPTVIYGAEEYAESKDRTVWSYGEVLSTAGKTRKMNYYAPYIDMTEISYAYTVTQAFGGYNGANTVAGQQFKDWQGVGVETLEHKNLVLMAESHDMYAQSSDSFSRYGAEVISKAWAVIEARSDTSGLYFARPYGYKYETSEAGETYGVPYGTLGKCEDFNWMNPEVAAANKFHTAFVGADEQVYASGDYVVIERWSEELCGAVIVNANGTNASVSVTSSHLNDGTYYDQITGAEFTVSGGTVTGQMGPTGIVVLQATEPELCEHPEDQQYTETSEATCTEPGWIYTYCGVCRQLLSKTQSEPALGHIDEDHDSVCDRCGTRLGEITVYFVDTNDWIPEGDYFNNIRVYAWKGSENNSWPGADMEIVGRSTDDHGIWMYVLDPAQYENCIFSAAVDGAPQTVDLPYVTDAGTASYVIYTAGSANGQGKYTCTHGAVLQEICGHTSYTVVDNGDGTESKICDCCGKVLSTSPFDEHIPGEAVEENRTEATCTEVGGYDEVVYCRICQIELTRTHYEIAPLGHAPKAAVVENEVAATCTDAGSYDNVVYCDRCGEELSRETVTVNALGHDWGEWTVTTAAACTEAGEEARTCNRCDETETRTIKALGHTPGDAVKENETAATCTKKGSYDLVIYCTVCGEKLSTTHETTKKLGHKWDKGTVITQPTCTEQGVKRYTCTRCKKTKDEKIPAIDCPCKMFVDMPAAGTVEHVAIDWAYIAKPQITNGMDATHFEPSGVVTRGQAVTFLWRAAGKPAPKTTTSPFVDVANPKAFYYKAVLWAVENGITNGMDATHFEPNGKLTKAYMLTFLYRQQGSPKVKKTVTYSDMTQKWYKKAVSWAVENGIEAPKSASAFGVNDACLRSRTVVYLYRTLTRQMLAQ